MTDIVAFLNARLDEDEAGALATTPVPVAGRWKAARDKHAADDAPLFLVQGEDEYEPGSEDYSGNSPVIAYSAEWQDEAEADLRFIARHDPARVLREVAAKRAIVWQWEQAAQRNRDDECDEAAGSAWATLSSTLVSLAGAYDSHPDYAGDRVEDWTWPDDDPAWTVAT